MSNRNELDRRNFLKSLLLGTGTVFATPFDIYLSNVLLHYLQRGNALAAGDVQAFADKKFIHFSMFGGATRWNWDLPLTPNDGDTTGMANQMLITKMTTNSGQITGGSYATTKIGNFNMPYMWSGMMPTPTGNVPMALLAQNMLTMRGIDLQVDGHDSNRYRQTVPTSGTSLLGIVAEQGTTPIPATAFFAGGNFYFSSKGVSLVDGSGGSPLSTFMNPFSGGSSLTSVSNSSVESALDRVMNIMSASSTGKHKYMPNTYTQRKNAKDLMKKDFGNLQGTYDTLKAKYQNLILRSFTDSSCFLEGVEDRELRSQPGDPRHGFYTSAGRRIYIPGDLRNIADSSTNVHLLAESMAVAEYMITQGFTSSVSLATSEFTNMMTSGGYFEDNNAAAGSRDHFSMDSHGTGAYAGLLMQTKGYRAYSACLYELITKLKEVPTSYGNLFNQTAIAVTSDFNRAPRNDGFGTEHGYAGSSYTIYSGAIPELTVVGNVTDSKDYYCGNWHAAPVDELGGRRALIGNVASTFATVLDLKSPTPNDASFVMKVNGQVKSATKGPKNVA